MVVIGSGFGGLAAAIRLAARGHRVTLLEKRDQPGGRAYVYRREGFSFDGGPTVITAPWLIEDLFRLAGQLPEKHVTLIPLDPFYRLFFPDGSRFDYNGDSDAMVREVKRLSDSPGDAEGYREFVRHTEPIFAKGFTELADKPFLRIEDMARIAPDLVRLGSYRSVYDYVSRFVADERLRQVLSFHPLLVGGNPFQTTSIYALIHFLEREWGVWYAKGGSGAIVDALVKLFADLGGCLELNSEVTEITVRDGLASGVTFDDGRWLPADIVICNADVAGAYRTLIPSAWRRSYTNRKLARMRYSMSLVVIYFGTDRLYRGQDGPQLAHHSIILGPRYRELLADIFGGKRLADDLSLYLH
ncbi:MAG: phytoene desaturase, partial [Chloroflexia bacterium]|nr:phytoene desaturase [Chloroflexia bacterium]